MGILWLALQLSLLPVNLDQSGYPVEWPVATIQEGSGPVCGLGTIVTVDYQIQDETGKEIANSERRGLASTLEIGAPNSDPLLSAAAYGAREGEERYVVLFVDDWYPIAGPGSLIGSANAVLVHLKLERVERR